MPTTHHDLTIRVPRGVERQHVIDACVRAGIDVERREPLFTYHGGDDYTEGYYDLASRWNERSEDVSGFLEQMCALLRSGYADIVDEIHLSSEAAADEQIRAQLHSWVAERCADDVELRSIDSEGALLFVVDETAVHVPRVKRTRYVDATVDLGTGVDLAGGHKLTVRVDDRAGVIEAVRTPLSS